MNLTLAQENLSLSYQSLSWRRLQYFLAYIKRGQNMDSILEAWYPTIKTFTVYARLCLF